MQKNLAKALAFADSDLLRNAPLPKSYTDFLGRKLFLFLLTLQGVGAFSLITLGVLLRKYRVAAKLIHPLIRREIHRSGLALVPMFVARPGYLPEPASREVAEARRSPVYTRDEVEAAAFGQSLELVSDDSALAYERAHGDPFPPAPWFEAWASGRHVFDLPAAAPPFELRWLVYRRV